MTKPSNELESPMKSDKKSYAPPQLIQYGTLREITLSAGNSGNSDGGQGSNKKTLP
jgi:hypothetical protein